MDALLAALPPQARLILLGDAGQLASVEAGSVLADLTRLAPPRTGLDAGRSAALAAAQGRTIQGGMASTWSDHIIRLQINHRSRAHPALAALAVALREGDAAAVGRVLDDAAQHDAKRVEPAHLDTAIDLIWDDCRAAMTAPGPAEALAALGRARILCALNDGPRGVAGLNRAVEARLRQAQVPVDGPWYRGRPVLIGANDPANGLFNGDLGVAWDGAVWFDDGHGGVRSVAPALLPEHRTAWAMTVHKAQGCEFIRVAVVLPDAPHALVTRELIYTAVTRAREQVRLVATPEVLAAACAASAVRESGLAERLRTMAV
jgi:exodeoxyribonuclease V alpha subunit